MAGVDCSIGLLERAKAAAVKAVNPGDGFEVIETGDDSKGLPPPQDSSSLPLETFEFGLPTKSSEEEVEPERP